MGIRKIGKALDLFVECTLYGYTYDKRKQHVERYTQKELRELKEDVKRKNIIKNTRSRNKE